MEVPALPRAHEAVNEAQALLGYTTLRVPTDGIVVDRRVEVGDTVMPGQVLLTMYGPGTASLPPSARTTTGGSPRAVPVEWACLTRGSTS